MCLRACVLNKVLVTVLDENDNPPVFSSPEYDVTVKENIANVTILRLQATDKDSGVNGHLTFTLLNASLGKFKVQRTSRSASLSRVSKRELTMDDESL